MSDAVCIDQAELLERLQTIKEMYVEEHKLAVAGGVTDCIHAVKTANPVEPQLKIITPEAQRTVSVEPFLEGGKIGRDVYRCGHCREVVGKHDNFCAACGRKLVDHHE